MPDLILDISMSLDGFVAGPNADLENPLGVGGMQLHEWVLGTKAWRESHGYEGGEDGADDDLTRQLIEQASATVMGRKMYSGGSGPWEDDPNANGWWGEDPPFHHDVFVLTHEPREPLALSDTTFHFVTDGIESALDQAKQAAGNGDIRLGGGADVAQQYLAAGLLDKVQLHVAPLLLGAGVRLFGDGPGGRLELTSVVQSPTGVVHLDYEPRS
ncbi:MAG TPA: dihydrofolate reductase family protein [Thermoleophilaceae bacterium]|jgi:dihydrofolate reductase